MSLVGQAQSILLFSNKSAREETFLFQRQSAAVHADGLSIVRSRVSHFPYGVMNPKSPSASHFDLGRSAKERGFFWLVFRSTFSPERGNLILLPCCWPLGLQPGLFRPQNSVAWVQNPNKAQPPKGKTCIFSKHVDLWFSMDIPFFVLGPFK